MKIRALLSAGTAVALALGMAVTVAPAARADVTTPGSFNTVESHRLLDTRKGLGAPKAAVAAGATLTFTATTDIAEDVGAVVLNVTAVNPQTRGHLTVFAAGTTRPLASNLNFEAGQNVPNLVITPVGVDGKVSVYNGSAGTVQVLADIHGYYLGGANTGVAGTYVPMASQRLLDTRKGVGAVKARVASRGTVVLDIAGVGGIPEDAAGIVANVTAVQGSGRGYINVFTGDPKPNVSTINYEMKEDRANLALISLGPDGSISLFNGSTMSVDMVVDVTGYFVGGVPATDGAFVPTTPFRIFDSRLGEGEPAGALTTSKIEVFPGYDPAFSFFKAVVVNVTAVDPEGPGYLTTWDGRGSLPSVSSSNFDPAHDVAGAVVLPVNEDGTISIYNGSYGNVDLVVDITGFVFALPEVVDEGGDTFTAQSASQQAAAAVKQLKKMNKTPASVALSVTSR